MNISRILNQKMALLILISMVFVECQGSNTRNDNSNKKSDNNNTDSGNKTNVETGDVINVEEKDENNLLVLIRNSTPQSVIVTSDNNGSRVKAAIKLFQQMLQKSSGGQVNASGTPTDKLINIYIGKNHSSVKERIRNLDEEGYIIKATTKDLVITGRSDIGVENGIYEFLERLVGVRWLMPTDLGIDVPHQENISVPLLDITENPKYLSRELSPIKVDGNESLDKWGRVNKLNTSRISFHHNLGRRIFTPSVFIKEHPEFFPSINGKRVVPKSDSDQDWQPNFSAPGIVDAGVSRVKMYFRKNSNLTSFSLGINDSWKFDESEKSRARRNGQKNFLGKDNVSDDYYKWVNDVVSKVREEFPNKKFGVLAYNNVIDPPTNMKLDKSIVPFITMERIQWSIDKEKARDKSLTNKWGQIVPELGWYDYAYGRSYLAPRVWFHIMKDYLQWGSQNKVKHYFAELYPNWGEGPKPWVLAKLLWNPNQNVDSLLNEWYERFAGKDAAPKLKEFYSIWEKLWTTDLKNFSKWKTGQQYLNYRNPDYLLEIPDTYVAQCDQLMSEVVKLAGNDKQKQRVSKLNSMWQIYRNAISIYKSGGKISTSQKSKGVMRSNNGGKSLLQQLDGYNNDPLLAPSVKSIKERIQADKPFSIFR